PAISLGPPHVKNGIERKNPLHAVLVAIIFSGWWCGRAGQISAVSRRRTDATRAFPLNSENFFCLMRTWQPHGRERDELRGAFLPPCSNAGAGRADPRQ